MDTYRLIGMNSNLIPYQRRALNAGTCGVEVEGGHRVKKLKRFVVGALRDRALALPTACRPCRHQLVLRGTGIMGAGALPGEAERACNALAWMSPLTPTSGARQWRRPGDSRAPSGAPR